MISSQTSQMTISDHFSELYGIIRISALGVVIASIFLSFFIDDFMKDWLVNLELESQLSDFSIYAPYDWINIKWTILFIFSITMVLPLTSIKLRSFALSGLYPREQRWFSLVLLTSIIAIPLAIFSIWFLVLPYSIEFFNNVGHIDGVTTRYDAVSIISLGIGVSWVFVIGIMTFLILSLSRLFGVVEGHESRVRIRIILISASMIFLTLPETYDGLRIIISFFTILFADSLSRIVPIYE
jgi:Sec-independent protein secretion pathway component TatC|tara:strand:+ start:3487 stop:4206 length:720 start_codon:yes stop_codon:yes gene_type:complete